MSYNKTKRRFLAAEAAEAAYNFHIKNRTDASNQLYYNKVDTNEVVYKQVDNF